MKRSEKSITPFLKNVLKTFHVDRLGLKLYITDPANDRRHNVGLYIPTLGRSCSRNVCFCGVCDVVRTFTPW